MTKDHVVVMGRKTFESIGKCLPDRINIVLSNTLTNIPDVKIIKNFDQLDTLISDYLIRDMKVFIIGGESLYNRYIPVASNILITDILKTFECDTYFPDIPTYFQLKNF